jgi:hypothetical protein
MDVKPVEAVLVEVGKAFRLCRFYPASHPSVQQALAALSSALPDLANVGTLELRITPTGFSLGTMALGARSPQLQELASLLYAQGHRGLVIEPGVTADEIAALIRVAGGAGGRTSQSLGVQTVPRQLPHIHLEQSARRSAAAPQRRSQSAAVLAEGPALAHRSTGEFRPDALPPEIEASRLLAQLEQALDQEAPRRLARLGEVATLLADQRQFAPFARCVLVLAKALRGERTEEVTAAASKAWDACVTSVSIAALVSRLGDSRASPDERDLAVQALGAVGAKAVPLVCDAFLASANEEEREVLLAVVRLAGEDAGPVVASRIQGNERPETARALALLLGAAGGPPVHERLSDFARHRDSSVRRAAVAGLARLGLPESMRLVAGALRDGDPEVRAEAAHGIELYGDHSATPIMLARLKDETDARVVVPLVRAFGGLREVRAVPALIELAKGVSGVFQRHPISVRAAAIAALGAIGTPEARATLEQYRHDRVAELREAAAAALASAAP